MGASLGPGRVEGAAAFSVEDVGRQGNDGDRQAGRDEIDKVVHAGCESAEEQVFFILVPDHGVEVLTILYAMARGAPPMATGD